MSAPSLDRLYAETRARVERVRAAKDRVARANPVHLADHLDRHYHRRTHLDLIGKAFCDIAAGKVDRLLITTPPQVGKSVSAAIWGPFWWLINHPRHRVIVASYADSLALTRGRAVRRLVMEHGHRYGLGLDHASRSVNDWSLISGGGMRSVGVGSGLTGHSGNLLICDDPHKDRAEADSIRIRENIWDWWSSTALTRLAPGAPVVLIMTRWHPDDTAGRVLDQEGRAEEGGRWSVLKMPAFASEPDDPLGRELGDPLPHPAIDPADVERARQHWDDKRKTMIVRDWFALCMGDPQPAEGALVTETLMRERTHLPPPVEPMKTSVAVDPSGGGRDTAGVIGGFLGTDQRLYVTDDVTLTGPSEKWGMAAAMLAADIGAETIVVEANYGGDQARVVIRSAWDRAQREHPGDERFARLAPQIKLVRAKKGKLLRAEPIAQQLSDDRMRLGARLPELVHEWTHWQPTNPDSPGRIDASCYLAYHLLPVPGASAVVSSPAGVQRGQVSAPPGRTRLNRSGY